jgi:sulfite exporter TauE/SafE
MRHGGPILIGAAIASLVGTPHCLGMCGGFAAASETPGQLAAWHAGRLLTYTALGAAAGGLGGVLPGPGWVGTAVAAILLVWFAAAIAGLVPEPRLFIPGLAKLGSTTLGRPGIPARFAFGVINGLLPCGLLYAAVGMAVGSGGAGWGALTLLVFGLGTLPGLSTAAIGLRTLLARHPWSRRVLAGVVLVSGLASLFIRFPGV